jgi:hypothetical protein
LGSVATSGALPLRFQESRHLTTPTTFQTGSEKEYDGSTILQLSSIINDKLIDYFLKNPTHLRSMKPRDFEQLIAELFDACGFTEYAVA